MDVEPLRFQTKAVRHFQPPDRQLPLAYSLNPTDKETWRETRIFILEDAFDKILKHAAGDLNNERFGILLGGVFLDPIMGCYWLEIGDMLPAEQAQASIASVEVSAEELERLNRELDHRLAETRTQIRKIGWYHTHPGHGIFMSSTDRNNQRQFYPASWQIALVVDPRKGGEFGIFIGPDSRPVAKTRIRIVTNQTVQDAASPILTPGVSLEMRPNNPAHFSAVAAASPQHRPPSPHHATTNEGLPQIPPRTIRRQLSPQRVVALRIAASVAVIVGFYLFYQLGVSSQTSARQIQRSFLDVVSTFVGRGDESALRAILSEIIQLDPESPEAAYAAQLLAEASTATPLPVKPTASIEPGAAPASTAATMPAAESSAVPTEISESTATSSTRPTPTRSLEPEPTRTTPSVPTPTAIPSIEYVIVLGDTLWELAQRYNTTVSEIIVANPGINPEAIYVGQVIVIPTN